MIEIRVTKDIREFEPKIVGPLTFRQLICLGIGAPICYVILKYLSPILTVDVAGFFCIIPAGAAYAIGWAEPYGMKMEKFLQSIFVNRVLAPANRKYKTVNTHEVLLKELAADCRFQRELAENEDGGKKKGKKRQSSQKRYKLSPKAYK